MTTTTHSHKAWTDEGGHVRPSSSVFWVVGVGGLIDRKLSREPFVGFGAFAACWLGPWVVACSHHDTMG